MTLNPFAVWMKPEPTEAQLLELEMARLKAQRLAHDLASIDLDHRILSCRGRIDHLGSMGQCPRAEARS